MFRKSTFWIVLGVYYAIFALLVVVVPVVSNSYLLWAWVVKVRTFHVILEYIIALIGAIIALFIFRQPQDDGSELLVCSKPLNHTKIIISKFIAFVLTVAIFAFGSSLICCFAFCIYNVNYWTVLSLIISLFAVNFIFTLLYGGIAIIISINHGKIAMIAGNIVVALLASIYSTVATVALKEPSTVITDSKTEASTNGSYIDYDNRQSKYEYILPLTDDYTEIVTKADLDWEKETYQNAVKQSLTRKFAPFNFNYHMYLIGNLWHLDDVRKQINGISELGATSTYDYKIDGLLHSIPTQSIDYTDDQFEEWSDFRKSNSPLFYTQYTGLKIGDLKYLTECNSFSIPIQDIDFDKLSKAFENVLTSLNVKMPCGISATQSLLPTTSILNGPYTDTRLLFRYEDPWSILPTYTVGKFYNGSSNFKNFQYYNPELINISSEEKDVFDYITYETMFDVNSEIYINCFRKNSTYYKLDFVSEKQNYLYSKYIYEIFNLDKVKSLLKLNSDYDFGLAFYKFKYYLSRQLLGYYGISNAICTNWNNQTADKITVPYENYFRLVYIPQYNSYYVRNIDDYKNEVIQGIDILPFDINPNEFFSYGSFVLPRMIDNDNPIGYDLLSWIFGKNSSLFPTADDDCMKRSSCEYDGTIDPSTIQNKEIYEIYNIYKGDWSNVDNHFGYFSELGLKLDTILNNFVFKRTPIYIDGDYSNLYNSEISSNSMLSLVFNRLAFRYSCNDAYNPYVLLGIYIVIDLLVLSVVFFRYIRHDFK